MPACFRMPDRCAVGTYLDINSHAQGRVCRSTAILKLGRSSMVFAADLAGPTAALWCLRHRHLFDPAGAVVRKAISHSG